MMRSRVTGRGVWCDCCSAWTATRAREKRETLRELCDDWPDGLRDEEYDYLTWRSDLNELSDSLWCECCYKVA